MDLGKQESVEAQEYVRQLSCERTACAKLSTHRFKILHEFLGIIGNLGIARPTTNVDATLWRMTLHKEAPKKEQQLIFVENARTEHM